MLITLLPALSLSTHLDAQQHQTHVTLLGDRSIHTQDEHGNFKHPFVNQPSHGDSIYYPDSKTMSVKLSRKPGPNINPTQESDWTTLKKSVKHFFTGESSTI